MIYQDLLDEVNIGQRFMCKSKHLIQYYGYSVNVKGEEVNLYLLMEKTIAEGDITTYIYKDEFWKPLTKEVYNKTKSNTVMYHNDKYWDYIMPTRGKLRIMKQMAIAISNLHKFKVVHCDLKPHNMLLLGDRVKLIDFNASQEIGDDSEMQGPPDLGTPGYMSPEMYDGWVSYKADISSLGVSMLEIWFGDIWPSESGKYEICRRYVLDYLSLLKKDNLQLHSLIKKCISTNTKKRPILRTIITNLDHILSVQETVE